MWRNVVSPKCACIAHAVLQEPEYLSGPQSLLADSVRHEMMSLKHWHDVTNFPGGFFNVPVRVSLQVLARGIFLFKHQVYLPTSNASPHTQRMELYLCSRDVFPLRIPLPGILSGLAVGPSRYRVGDETSRASNVETLRRCAGRNPARSPSQCRQRWRERRDCRPANIQSGAKASLNSRFAQRAHFYFPPALRVCRRVPRVCRCTSHSSAIPFAYSVRQDSLAR